MFIIGINGKEHSKKIEYKLKEINIYNINIQIYPIILKIKETILEKQIDLQEQSKYKEFNAIVSYYTYLPECTNNGLGITASGKKVSETSVAIPRDDDILKFGVEIKFETLSPKYIEDYEGKYLTRIADDTGNPKYIRKMENGTYRLDVFCPKLPNETNESYYKRVNSYGKTNTKIRVHQ